MKELDKKRAPAISGGHAVPEEPVIPVNVPDDEFPQNPNLGTGEDDLHITGGR